MDWPPGAHASTFGGNPVCIAAALATLRLIEDAIHGKRSPHGRIHSAAHLRRWPSKYAIVGDVRGKGLMIGVEIVKDRKTKERAGGLRDAIVNRAFAKGLLILGAGENVVRLCPPLVIDEEQASFAIRALADCLRETQESM